MTVKCQSCNHEDAQPLFEEALMYFGSAAIVYLYADMRNLSGTGRLYTSFESIQAEKTPLATTDILTTLLDNLRREAAKDKDGLVHHVKGKSDQENDDQLTQDEEIQRKRYTDKTLFVLFERHVKNSLKVPGPDFNPKLCVFTGDPLPPKSIPESCKHHVGSHEHNICAKHGLHFLQLLVDGSVQNSDVDRKGKTNGGSDKKVVPIEVKNIEAEEAALDKILGNGRSGDAQRSVLASQFKEGSLWYNLIESGMEIVWFNDRYPHSEIVYGIAIQEKMKRICVFFRGTVNLNNWGHNLMRHRVAFPNPVQEEYPEREDTVMIHNGFSKYLFFKRRDNNKSKYDEIVEKICEIGKEKFSDQGGDLTVVVTGHSLGGALATIFGLYASADERLPHSSPVRLFTYASPYVAGQAFANAFRHQEESKKLVHARLYNKKDLVAHIPANMVPKKSGAPYEHNGIGIELKPGKEKMPRYTRVKEYSGRW
eukprot:CAMPEP_0196815034 /NCGR_PEP_ID=MMETSP1362-20130617/47458_1 /TAXON_ID=163516 /ORGANISM="Leptocylindrus danicus, Strain CCMP1856" /LENGTH=480 /DNA_ID=CAMNT_0042191867 /DNA_START=19 /DNA_END=1458 /DNA_ORIENTATION=+